MGLEAHRAPPCQARRWLARWTAACAAAAVILAIGVANAGTRVTGTITEASLQLTFECIGEPVCRGSYRSQHRYVGCSNSFAFAGDLEVRGMDLSAPGNLVLDMTLGDMDANDLRHPDGSCSIRPGTITDFQLSVNATFDGTRGTIAKTFTAEDGRLVTLAGDFKAERDVAPPVFPMEVQASFDQVANVKATIRYRPQDVGSTGSVYVFAVAPVTSVRAEAPKAQRFGHAASGNRTTGPPFGPAFDRSRVQVFEAGSVAVSFNDASNGTLTYTVSGVTATKAITRQTF